MKTTKSPLSRSESGFTLYGVGLLTTLVGLVAGVGYSLIQAIGAVA